MKRYEGLFILNTAGREENVKELIDGVTTEITSAGGKIETVQKLDKRPFARVADKRHASGFYVNFSRWRPKMGIARWTPRTELSKQETFLMRRLVRTRKLL